LRLSRAAAPLPLGTSLNFDDAPGCRRVILFPLALMTVFPACITGVAGTPAPHAVVLDNTAGYSLSHCAAHSDLIHLMAHESCVYAGALKLWVLIIDEQRAQGKDVEYCVHPHSNVRQGPPWCHRADRPSLISLLLQAVGPSVPNHLEMGCTTQFCCHVVLPNSSQLAS
jgi:hypothetical protein